MNTFILHYFTAIYLKFVLNRVGSRRLFSLTWFKSKLAAILFTIKNNHPLRMVMNSFNHIYIDF